MSSGNIKVEKRGDNGFLYIDLNDRVMNFHLETFETFNQKARNGFNMK